MKAARLGGSSQVKSRVTRHWAKKHPGTKSGKQEETPSPKEAGSVCVCGRLSSFVEPGGMSVRVRRCAQVWPPWCTIFLACCKGRSFCLAARRSSLVTASPTHRAGNTLPSVVGIKSIILKNSCCTVRRVALERAVFQAGRERVGGDETRKERECRHELEGAHF